MSQLQHNSAPYPKRRLVLQVRITFENLTKSAWFFQDHSSLLPGKREQKVETKSPDCLLIASDQPFITWY